MSYIQGADRSQAILFPETLDTYVNSENPVRFIDAYVESLDMVQLGFTHARPAPTGRPPYRPQDLLKLYVYGYLHKIRSSRALERETHRNMELLWLLGKLQPDFKTIADFRKNNTESLTAVCSEFIVLCKRLRMFGGELVGIDGSKFEAVNHSSRSYTRGKLQRQLAEAEQQMQEWLSFLEQSDSQEQPGVSEPSLQQKIAQLEKHKAQLEGLRTHLEDSGESGVSLTDSDSRIMRTGHNGRDVCYNVQIAVDSKHKLIVAHQVSTQQNDLHQLLPMARQAKAVLEAESLEVVADTGYYNEQALVQCEREDIPCYVPAPDRTSKKADAIFSEHDFIYLPELDAYQCPAEQTLPYKSSVYKRGKRTRIYETSACQTCPLRPQCTTAKRGNRRMYRWIHKGMVEAILARLQQNPEKIKLRAQLVEHPFGTLKRAMGHGYFLTKGIERVSAEMSLSVLAYNMKRVLNIMGMKELMEAVQALQKTVWYICTEKINGNIYSHTL